MFACKISCYPNRETRVVLHPVAPPRNLLTQATRSTETRSERCRIPAGEAEDDTPSTPPCHYLQTQNQAPSKGFKRQKPGFGGVPKPTKFGNRARRSLLRSGAALESLENGRESSLFCTLTLPGSTNESLEAIALWSSFLVDRFKSWLAKCGATSYSLYVWERQKRGALHLHYVAYVPDKVANTKIRRGIQAWWHGCLCRLSDKIGVDMFARAKGGTWRGCPSKLRADAVPVKKSVAAYLSKYLGKSSRQLPSDAIAPTWYPVRWFGISRPLLELTRSLTTETVYYGTTYRNVKIFYDEVTAKASQGTVKEYSYSHRYTRSEVWVGFGSPYTVEELWMSTKHVTLGERFSQHRSKRLAVMSSQLRAAHSMMSLGDSLYSRYYGESSAQILRRLQVSSLSEPTDCLEAATVLQFALHLKYKSLKKRLPSIGSLYSELEAIARDARSLLDQDMREKHLARPGFPLDKRGEND